LILKLISPLRPGLIQSGDERSGFIYLVMPIRLNV
jgi:DNA polymerase III sliding clamp (beta) subunit (PCNA family)